MGMVFPVSTHNYELRYWLAAGGLNPGFYAPERHLGPDRRRGAALGHAAAADAGDARGGHDRRLLGRRAVEPGGGLQGHRRAGHHRRRDLREQPGEGLRPDRGIRRGEPEHHAGAHQGADPRRRMARRRRRRQPGRGGRDPVALRLRRRRRRGHRQLDDRHLRVREGRHAPGAGLQHLLPRPRELSVLLRRGLDADPDAPLGADPRGQARRLVRRDREVGLQARDLRAGRAAARRRGQGQARRTSPSAPTATSRRPTPSSTASNTTAASPTTTSRNSRSG